MDLLGQFDQLIGPMAARTDDNDDVMARLFGGDGPSGGSPNLLGIGDAGAAKLLNNDSQRLRLLRSSLDSVSVLLVVNRGLFSRIAFSTERWEDPGRLATFPYQRRLTCLSSAIAI